MLRYLVVFSLLIVGCVQAQTVGTLKVTPEHRVILNSESLTFTVTASFATRSSALDVSGLAADFDIVDTSFTQHSHLINLQQSTSSSWTYKVKPKRLGELVIPAMTAGNATSAEIVIKVLAGHSEDSGNQPDVFVESNIAPTSGVVQQPFVYSVSVYRVNEIYKENLDVTFPDTTLVTQLPTERTDNVFKNGKRYNVLTQSYIVVPQIDGSFRLPEPTLTGSIRQRNKGSFGQLYAREENVFVKGEVTRFSASPAPPSFNGNWLPAEQVTLALSWQSDINNLTLGQPIMLSVDIQAQGVEGRALPDVRWQLPDSLRAYPDKPQVSTRVEQGTLIGNKSMTLALVPDKSGHVALPEIQLPWYNINTQKTEFATVAATTLNIEADPAFTNNIAQSNTWAIGGSWLWPGACALLFAYCVFITLKHTSQVKTLHDIDGLTDITPQHTLALRPMLSKVKKAPVTDLIPALTQYFKTRFGGNRTLYSYVLQTENTALRHAVDALYQFQYGQKGNETDVRQNLHNALRQESSESKNDNYIARFFTGTLQ